ncbi:MAG TPA: 1,2-phenylacetyl-CoA epoxidase subunit PaaD [Pedococcus sp.]|nr:1,2-phenylacetyl-CoA epoxidase subunit PaaD [Pedococcus sp.]
MVNAVVSEVVVKDAVAQAIADIPDPEVPVVSIEDLGILRGVVVDEAARHVRVTITPTYSGCPAMDVIGAHIRHVAGRSGYTSEVVTQLSPAWTTDWLSDRGRARLHEFGIAPPAARVSGSVGESVGAVGVSLHRRQVSCPQCGSTDTEELARFGSTACKALRRCRACREPFDEFKAL